MEFVHRAFTEFFDQIARRKCAICGKIAPKENMIRHDKKWRCHSCDDPEYKSFIDSVGL